MLVTFELAEDASFVYQWTGTVHALPRQGEHITLRNSDGHDGMYVVHTVRHYVDFSLTGHALLPTVILEPYR